MNNKICNGCGQTNFPNAQVCTNCGVNLTGSDINSFGSQKEEDPLKTVVVGGQEMEGITSSEKSSSSKAENKSNSKLYWILGGIGGLIVISGFLVFVLAIGIFIYASSGGGSDVATTKTEEQAEDTGKPDAKPLPSDKPVTKGRVFTDKEIAAVFKLKKKVGKFKQLVVLPASKDSAERTFENADGQATAIYSGKGKKESIIYVLASYSEKEKAQEEFRKFIASEKQKGAKMVLDTRVDENNKSIEATYKMGVVTKISFCSWKISTATMCHSMMSPNPAAVINFHNAWFGIS